MNFTMKTTLWLFPSVIFSLVYRILKDYGYDQSEVNISFFGIFLKDPQKLGLKTIGLKLIMEVIKTP